MKSKKSSVPIISLVTFIITLVVNYGSMLGWFGLTQEEISNQYKNFITPEPFTFSIWGVIYILVLLFLIKDLRNDRVNTTTHSLFIISNVLNIAWNLLWVNDLMLWSTIAIFLFTFVLGFICLNLRESDDTLDELAFSIYFGWLTVATVTNVATYLVSINWNMFGLEEHLIACLMYIITAVLAGVIIFVIKMPTYNLPIIWAFFGIVMAIEQHNGAHSLMPLVIYSVIAVLVIQMIIVFFRKHEHHY